MPEPATPRPSACVILVRNGESGLETFMVRRHAESRVAPKAFVFPGGTVRSDDRSLTLAAPDLSRSDTPLPPDEARAYAVAAIRELFEEAGVLLARDAGGCVLEVDDSDVQLQEELAAARLTLQSHGMSLAQLLERHDWSPAVEELIAFSHWVTPAMLAVRFDTRFFVAAMPPRQNALHCTIETSEGIWLRPAALLDGAYPVVYATAQHLRRLAPFSCVADLLAFARTKPIKRVQPLVRQTDNGREPFLDAALADSW